MTAPLASLASLASLADALGAPGAGAVELPAGLAVAAAAGWPQPGDGAPKPLAGFVVSTFSPLAAEVAERCLRAAHGEPPAAPARGERTAVVVVSVRGDVATNTAVAQAVDAGRPAPPLLFFQSVPNAVAGYVARRWGLYGPVVCLSPVADPLADGLAEAALLLDDGDADEALVLAVEPACLDGERDTALAVLVARAPQAPPGAP